MTPRRKTARARAGRAVPAAAAAATLVAGAAAYILAGGAHSATAMLSAPVSLPVSSAAVAGQGGAHAAGSAAAASAAMLRAASAAGNRVVPSATARVPRAEKASAKASPPKSPTAAPGGSRTAPASAPSAPVRPPASPSAPASSSAPASQAAHATTVSCAQSSGMLPANVTAIVSFLLANGYSHNAAAGIAGNIFQESKGDPESVGMGGGGLIGWTPLRAGMVTGNPATDLQTQLAAILTYNQQWASYLPALNSAASPAAAADIYVTDFERAGIPAAGTREASASAVAAACGL